MPDVLCIVKHNVLVHSVVFAYLFALSSNPEKILCAVASGGIVDKDDSSVQANNIEYSRNFNNNLQIFLDHPTSSSFTVQTQDTNVVFHFCQIAYVDSIIHTHTHTVLHLTV